jgi:glycosyltransferase involved in cell wall biosynthesis
MRILLLSPTFPNLANGSAQRTAIIRNALQQFGEVTTLVMRQGHPLYCKNEPAPSVVAEIGYPMPGLLRRYREVEAATSLVQSILNLDEFDMVVSRYLYPIAALPKVRGMTIVDADDAHYTYPSDRHWHSRFLASTRRFVRVRRGGSVLRRADHVWFCCQRDFDAFSLRSASVLPNVVGWSDITAESVAASEPVVLMVGLISYYRPNRDAVEAFIASCWSEIRRLVPEARFRIAGEVSPEDRWRWSSVPGVECAGFVEDLEAEYRQARLTVAPIQWGGGTQIKALESLSHGRAPVVSSFVAEGYSPHLKDREALYVADEPAEQIRRVVELLQNPSSGEAVARRGQEIVRHVFSHERFVEKVVSSLAPLAPV